MACPKFERTQMLMYLGVMSKYYPEILTGDAVGINQTKELLSKMLDEFLRINYPVENTGLLTSYITNPADESNRDFASTWNTALFALQEVYKESLTPFPYSQADLVKYSKDIFKTISEEVKSTVEPEVVKEDTQLLLGFADEQKPTETPTEEGGTKEGIDSDDDTPTPTAVISTAKITKEALAKTTGISAVIKDVLGPQRAHMYDDLVKFLRNRVAEGWIAQEVDAEGNVGGFVSVSHSSRKIAANLNTRLVRHLAGVSNGEILEYNSDSHSGRKLLYFDKNRLPANSSLEEEGEGYKIYSHNVIRDYQGIEKSTPTLIVVGESFDDVMDNLAIANGSDITVIAEYSENTSERDHLITDFSEDKVFDQKETDLYFSNILSQNLQVFLDAFYPQLGTGFKQRVNVSWTDNSAGVSASDADSVATKMHKATTPRLVFKGFTAGRKQLPILSQDTNTPYLSLNDFDNISDIWQRNGFRRDRVGLTEDILNYLDKDSGSEESQILASIYYRFLAPSDYSVESVSEADGTAQTKTFRSYAALATRNKYKSVSMDEYINGMIDSKSKSGKSIDIISNSNGDFTVVIDSKSKGLLKYSIKVNPFANNNISESNLPINVETLQEGLTGEEIEEIARELSIPASLLTTELQAEQSLEKFLISSLVAAEQSPWETNNHLLDLSLNSMITNLSSTAKKENAMSSNNKISKTDNKSFSVTARFKESFANSHVSTKRDGISFTKPSAIGTVPSDQRLKISPNGDGSMHIAVKNPTGGIDIIYKVRLGNIVKGVPQGGFLFDIESNQEWLTNTQIMQVFKQFDLPKDVMSVIFATEFNSNLGSIENMKYKDKGAFEKFVLSNLLVMEINSENSKLTSKAFTNARISKSNNTTTLSYDPLNMLFGYKDILRTTMNGLFGEDNRNYTLDHNGNRLANVSVKNKVSDNYRLAAVSGEGSRSIHKRGLITGSNPRVKITDQLSKTGIRMGDTIKANQDMTIREQLQFQIEQAFLQTAHSSAKWNKVLLQFGVMSDRKDVPLIEFEAKDNYPIFPVTSNMKLDEVKLRDEFILSQRNYWEDLGDTVKSSWAGAFSKLSANGLNLTNLNINPSSSDIFAIAKVIEEAQIPYSLMKENTELVDNAMIEKGPGGIAVIPKSLLQNVALFQNEVLSKAFVKANLDLFKTQIKSTGFTSLTPSSLNILKDRFQVETDEEAYNILTTAFFYQSNTLGNEVLRLQTGGFSQFKIGWSPALFNIDPISGIKPNEVIAKAKETLANDKALKEAGENPILDKLTTTFIENVLSNKNLKANKELQARVLVFDDMAKIHSSQYIDQIKRNAGMGSTHQHPTLMAPNQAGFGLGQSSKNVTFNDPDIALDILGKSDTLKQDIFDAVQLGHPLYFIRLFNSLGGTESGYAPTGAPVKDITNEIDGQGFFRFQKKATFEMFSNEVLRKSTTKLYNILKKMNTAVTFKQPLIAVHEVDPITLNPIIGNIEGNEKFVTRDMWLQNGENMGQMWDTETETWVHGKTLVADLQSELEQLRANDRRDDIPKVLAEFESRFAGNRYKTDKVFKQFNNLQQLWEFFGGIDNDTAWNLVAGVIGNMSTDATQIDLSDATYANRDAYVEKVGFKTQEKVGSKQLLHKDDLLNDGKSFKTAWSEVDNTYHGVILQADHNPDTTTSDFATDAEHEHENEIPMITQVLSACIGEGNTSILAADAYDAVGTASEAFIKNLDATLQEKIAFLAEMKGVENLVFESDEYNALEQEIISDYLRDLAKEGLSSRESPGIIGELIGDDFKDKLSFNLKQVLPLMTSLLNSKFNRSTVRMKFPGGQYVVAPSHNFVETIDIPGVVSGLTRNDINNILNDRDSNKELYDKIIAYESEIGAGPAFAFAKVDVNNVLPGDKVTIDVENPTYKAVFEKVRVGSTYTVSQLKRIVRNIDPSIDFNSFLKDTAKYRLGGIKNTSNTLKWGAYLKYDADGNATDAMKHKDGKYQAYKAVDQIAKSKLVFDNKLVNKELVKVYYFGSLTFADRLAKVQAYNPEAKPEHVRDTWTPAEDAEFEVWYEESGASRLASEQKRNTFIYIKGQIANDPYFRKRVEKQLFKDFEEGNYVTESAEFFMPSMHKDQYLIEDGDSLYDIIGEKAPNFNKLISMGIIGIGTFTTGETSITFDNNEDLKRYMETHHTGAYAVEHKNEFDRIFKAGGYFDQLPDNHKAVYNQEMGNKEAQYRKSTIFFEKRAREKFESSFLGILNAKSLNTAGRKIKEMKRTTSSSSNLAITLDQYMGEIEKGKLEIEETKNSENPVTEKDILTRIHNRSYATDFYINRAQRMASGFPLTLEFITARIPAQGMQSFTSGRIKNFIFSTRNSCYGPLEMLTMTGADYDIDKQNMMTWAMNDDGELIDWTPFLNEKGKMDYKKFEDWNKTSDMKPKESELYFKKATQNFIVHRILTIIKSPVNAIQANTPVSMGKVSSAKTDPDLSKATTSTSEAELLGMRELASPFNPYSTFKYERLNMDGKSGIGIFASDLKSYFAAYYAIISSEKADKSHVVFKTNSGLELDKMEKLGINPEAVQYFDLETGEMKVQSTTVSNANKFDYQGKENYKSTIKAKQSMVDAGQDSEAQYKILSEYIEDIGLVSKWNVDEQAWEDLSELLSAATDNAKELILGEINATSSTSSIISTMIRMGIDLEYALQLMGHSKPFTAIPVTIGIETRQITNVRDLISFLEEADDTQSEVSGNNRLLSVLEKIQPDLKGLPTDKYLAHPFRQLYTFAAMSDEFSLLSSLLSINQGLKNSGYESWKFKTSLEARMNDILDKGKSKLTFDLKKFIDDVSSTDDPAKQSDAAAIISAFDESRVGINVPYILSKNKHYFGYYKAMFQSIDMIRKVSDIDTITDQLLDKADEEVKRFVDLPRYKSIQDYIYNAGVESYMKSEVGIVVIDGLQFDLTMPSAPFTAGNEVGGRFEFVNYLPKSVKTQLDNGDANYFLQSLPIQNVEEDYATKIAVPVLKGPNLNNLSSDRFSQLQMGLSKLELDNKPLHDALFLYSLITTRGGYAGGSFMGLYETKHYAKFSEFVKTKLGGYEGLITNPDLDEILKYNNSFLLPQVTTDKRNAKIYANKDGKNIPQEDLPGFIEQDQMEPDYSDQDSEAAYTSRKKSFLDVQAELFSVAGITQGKLNKNIKADVVSSRDTNILYKWDDDKQIWIPQIQLLPKAVIPYSITNNRASTLDTGFTDGWEFLSNDKDAAGNPIKATVIAYVDKAFVKRLKGRETRDRDFAANLGVSESDVFPRKENYLVRQNGAYRIMTDKQIQDGTKTNISLHKDRIVINSVINKEDEPLTDNLPFFKDTKSGAIYSKPLTGGKKGSKSMLTNFRPSRVGYSDKLQGEIDTATLHSIVKEKEGTKFKLKTTPYSKELLDREFAKLKDDYLVTAFEQEFSSKIDYLDSNQFATRRDRSTRDRLMREANSLFDPNLHIIKKMNMLYDRDRLFSKFEGKKQETTRPSPVNLPQIIKTTLLNPELMKSVHWGDLQQLFRNVGVPGSQFKKLLQKSLMGNLGSLDVYISEVDNKVIFKEGMVPKFYEDRVAALSKKLEVPESFRQSFNKKASPEVLAKITKALNGRFPNTTFALLNTKEILSQYGKEYAKSDVKAFVINGEVVINSDNATLDSPLHEFSHIYMQHIKVDNKDLYKKIVTDSLLHPLAEHVRKSYPQLSEYELGEEVFVSLVATQVNGTAVENNAFNRVMEHVSSGSNILSKVMNFFKSIFGDMFGVNMKDYSLSMNDSLGTIIEKVGDKLAYSDASMLSDISLETRNAIKQTRVGSDIDYKAAKEFLLSKGFIRRVCT